MRKFFHGCFVCFVDKEHKCKKVRIPRKSKKSLKNLISLLGKQLYSYEWNTELCQINRVFKDHKYLLMRYGFFRKYIDQIKIIEQFEDYQMCINNTGKLAWKWESDDDFGGTSGLMPFAYDELSANGTWAYSEVKSLFESIYNSRLPSTIKCDTDLLEYLKNNSVPPYIDFF